jgi:hypothetical protein
VRSHERAPLAAITNATASSDHQRDQRSNTRAPARI